jgi:hypothetical protein
VPLLAATVLNGLMLRWRPKVVPRGLVLGTFLLQVGIGVVTAALAIPLQTELGTAGHSPAEVVDLLDRLVRINWLRDVPGVAVALAFVWMLHRGGPGGVPPARCGRPGRSGSRCLRRVLAVLHRDAGLKRYKFLVRNG